MPPILLTKTIATQQETPIRFYLWPLLPDNSIVITEHIFYNTHQIPTLSTHLSDTADQSVYLDLSQNPEVLDAPHAIGIFDRLREIAPLKIVVNEYRKFYTPQKNFIYYPAFFHAYSHGTYLDPTSIVNFPKFAKKTKPFMSLNNRAVWHRIWLFTELASNNLLHKIEYSFVWNPKTTRHDQLDQLPDYKRIQAESLLDLLPIRFAHEKHLEFNADQLIDLHCHNECAVNIVTESSPNLGFLSEKICKPLACFQIPILLSYANATQFCVDAGFDMFEDIIPWRTWDSIEDEQQRCDVACKFIVDYIKHGDALADWHRCQDRVIANRERLVSDDFKQFCVDQFTL